MGLWFKLKFQLLKMVRMCWFTIRYSFYQWKKIEGIYIPVKMNYGYSVLRFIDNGAYEHSEITIIKHTLEREDVVLELGTGMGFISAYCAMQIGNEKIHTFEANSSLKEIIETLYKKNKVHPFVTFSMLGEKPGTKIFYRNTKSFLASSTEKTKEKKQTVTVIPVLDLNEIIRNIRPTYLMMDIEGGEYDIFNSIDFQSIRKIQFELHPLVLGSEKVNAIFNQLRNNNFSGETTFNFGNNFYFQKN